MTTKKTKTEKPLLRRYSAALTNFFCDKIEDGETIAEICRNYKDQGIPNEKQIYRWKKRHPEFKEAIDLSYQTFFYKKIDELEELSKAELPKDMDKQALSAEVNRRRIRIDALKFILAKLAPKMVPDLRDTPQNAVQVNLPPINIVNYKKLDSN